MRSARLYARYLGISIRSQLQYRASFVMQAIGNFVVNGGEFLAVWALLSRFGQIDGWSLPEVAVFYGTVSVAFAIADAISTGFDRLGDLVRHGEFDRYLLRPRSTVLQLLGYQFTLRRVGRFLQGLVVLAYGLSASFSSGTPWVGAGGAVAAGILLLWTIAGCVAFFTGLMMIQAVIAFRTVESVEIMNVFTYGGVQAAEYPFAIYARWFRRFFTFVIPLGAVTYYPVLTLLGVPDPGGTPLWVGWISPAAGFAFLLIAASLWRVGIRWYSSTGS